jgi:putative endonuclease
MWYVYILQCADDSLYTGITNNLEKRLKDHNESPQGAKYTKARRPVHLVYSKRKKNRSYALKEEAAIKKMTRAQKLTLLK